MTTTVYKLTYNSRGKYYTKNGTVWGPHKSNSVKTKDSRHLCTCDFIHFYIHPLQAALMREKHVSKGYKYLWVAKAKGKIKLAHDKAGARTVTTLRREKLPRLSWREKDKDHLHDAVVDVLYKMKLIIARFQSWSSWGYLIEQYMEFQTYRTQMRFWKLLAIRIKQKQRTAPLPITINTFGDTAV